MFLTVHSTTGVLIGQNTESIWLAFIIGFISHFILDMIPHGDSNLIEEKFKFAKNEIDLLKKLGSIDVLVMSTVLSALYLSGQITNIWPVAFAITGSLLPDLIQAIYILTNTPLLKKYFSLHWNLHFALGGLTVKFKTGLLIQFLFLIGFITAILLS